MSGGTPNDVETLDLRDPVWERVFTVAPLVLVGTTEVDGRPDIAPKHMALALGWENRFGFVCTPRHHTYHNALRTRAFTVSYPRPSQIAMLSLTAAPRCQDIKPIVDMLETFPAQRVAGVLVAGSYLYLECELDRVIDDLGDNSLITGTIVAAHVHRDALRMSDRDDAELLLNAPQIAYLYPGRFAVIDRTEAFPFPAGMRR